jgi:hypothetical protein
MIAAENPASKYLLGRFARIFFVLMRRTALFVHGVFVYFTDDNNRKAILPLGCIRNLRALTASSSPYECGVDESSRSS